MTRRFLENFAFASLIAPVSSNDQAQCVDWTLWRLCRLLEAEIGHRFQANLYLNPLHGNGSNPHWDDRYVFVLQVYGRKKWQLETQSRALPAGGDSTSPEGPVAQAVSPGQE